jgi:amphi-Trp domain-containing protein
MRVPVTRIAMTTMKFKKQERLTRVEAAARLTEIAKALRNSAKLELGRGGEELELELDIPEDVELEIEVEIGDAETELEVEIKWTSGASPAASTGPDSAS